MEEKCMIDPQRNCYGLRKAEELGRRVDDMDKEASEMDRRLVAVEQRSKSNSHRIDKLEGDFDVLNRLATAVEVMATEQKHQGQAIAEVKTEVTALGEKVDVMEKQPGKTWTGIKEKFLAGLVGALAAALFSGIVYLLTVSV